MLVASPGTIITDHLFISSLLSFDYMQEFSHVCFYGHCPPVGGLPIKLPPNDLKDLLFL